MKSQLILQTSLIRDVYEWFGIDPGKDITTLCNRFSREGDSFLEVALPSLESALLGGIESGSFSPLTGWKKAKGSELPLFLNDLWKRVFAPNGDILDSMDINAVRGLRQILVFSKKIFEVCSDARIEESLNDFRNTDQALGLVSVPRVNMLSVIFDALFSKTITRTMMRLYQDPAFKHGPGAVSERYRSRVAKYSFESIPSKIIDLVGYDTFRPFWTDPRTPRDEEVPARLIAVPKTALKPRLICIEPSYNQYVQQGMQSILQSELENTPCGYSDQSLNQRLAKLGSEDGSWSTIDLSEASDRVHNNVLLMMLDSFPLFSEFIQSCRSENIQLPDGSKLRLRKFASMGNALTFPIEAMYFTTLVVYGMCVQDGEVTHARAKALARSGIRVYGDDIIIPTEYFDTVTSTLESFGLKVNRSKSFRGRKKGFSFRESCGGDYINGVDITPIYRRSRVPSSLSQVDEIVSSISTQNHLSNSQIYPKTAMAYSTILHNLGVPTLPFTSSSKISSSRKRGWKVEDSEPFALGVCPCCVKKVRYDDELQRNYIKLPFPVEQLRGVPIEDWERLQSSLDRSLVPNKDRVVDRSPDGRVGRLKLRPTRVEIILG